MIGATNRTRQQQQQQLQFGDVEALICRVTAFPEANQHALPWETRRQHFNGTLVCGCHCDVHVSDFGVEPHCGSCFPANPYHNFLWWHGSTFPPARTRARRAVSPIGDGGVTPCTDSPKWVSQIPSRKVFSTSKKRNGQFHVRSRTTWSASKLRSMDVPFDVHP